MHWLTWNSIPLVQKGSGRQRIQKMSLLAYCSIGLFGCLLVGPFTGGVQAAGCPANWLAYNGHCYGYYSQELNWNQAQAQCKRRGGNLASIQHEQEHEAIANFLRRSQRWDDEDVWLGLSIPAMSRRWVWADRTPLAYTAWEKPKSYFALKGEHCAVLEESSGFMLWDNDSCFDRNPFLCKV
ncbi:hypothetical protein lerEdw1_020878 [Lerista edwardsae]|nr:hypothetical protein lerEdw1_020878 [Lerista edwardsae]